MKNNKLFLNKIINITIRFFLIMVVSSLFLTTVKAQNTIKKDQDGKIKIQTIDTTKKVLMLQKNNTEQQKSMQSGKPVFTNKYGELIDITKKNNYAQPKANNEAIELKKDTLKK